MTQVCRLKPVHIGEVARIEELCFSEPWSEKSLLMLTKNNGIGFVVTVEDKVVSYGGMLCVAEEGQITNIATHPEYRRNGYGEAVVNALIRHGKVSGLQEIYLEVRVTNQNAIDLYAKLGFERVGERKNFYRDPVENAAIMKITL